MKKPGLNVGPVMIIVCPDPNPERANLDPYPKIAIPNLVVAKIKNLKIYTIEQISWD